MDEKTGAKSLAFLRAALGIWIVWLALPNLDHSYIERLPTVLEKFAFENPIPIYRWLMYQVAIPNIEQVGAVLSVGQTLVGAALIIGFLTRFTALVGSLYALNLIVATSHMGSFHQGFGFLLLLSFITLMMGDAGKALGIDGFLFKERKEPASKPTKFKSKKQKDVVETLSKQVKSKSSKKKKSVAQAK